MATYEYRCTTHGTFDRRMRMGTAPSLIPCPQCGEDAARILSIPMVSRVPRGISTAIERTQASADHPATVSSLPPSREGQARITRNPKHRRLPRP
ncbi:FmdB family zinc ribbon protein [Pistricoccus aurantiacus]|uniref:Zinc ribbon domain-containing protein n=1 Tax=Pistricoccus aurantiacus TaxID=1883414 RepID=A0A5B8SN68_9GAMM|nr:zinc ribbon domain-containing protein [Pistricoccus aurantiacus]QEA38509.1 zinc ribbon domain-containing protein [Pistricoccus aurantiacus]